MTEFNKFNLYQYNNCAIKVKDEVDKHIDVFESLDSYTEIKKYISENFSTINNDTTINFNYCNKECHFNVDTESIYICCYENEKLIYNKGWCN